MTPGLHLRLPRTDLLALRSTWTCRLAHTPRVLSDAVAGGDERGLSLPLTSHPQVTATQVCADRPRPSPRSDSRPWPNKLGLLSETGRQRRHQDPLGDSERGCRRTGHRVGDRAEWVGGVQEWGLLWLGIPRRWGRLNEWTYWPILPRQRAGERLRLPWEQRRRSRM